MGPMGSTLHWPPVAHSTPETLFLQNSLLCGVTCLALLLIGLPAVADDRPWPALPDNNGAAELPAQEWPFQPGPRTITAYVYYPGAALANIDAQTGLFLSLHNWGGTNAIGTADPQFLADRYNTIAICVD